MLILVSWMSVTTCSATGGDDPDQAGRGTRSIGTSEAISIRRWKVWPALSGQSSRTTVAGAGVAACGELSLQVRNRLPLPVLGVQRR